MRERTPSADDNPSRAPPAPLREAASADVTGSKTSNEPVEVHRGPKFSSATTASSASVDARMVASTHNLDELSVSHPTSASSDRQQQQEKHGHAYRSAQTAQDKRSRLSNVINNLRKKVPDSRNGDSPRKEEDDRNSVERNLETLEKYVMTVLNGVIKDEEDDREVGRKKEEKGKDSEKLTEEQEDEDSKGPTAKFEPSKPNESRTEAAVFPSKQPEKPEAKEPCAEHWKLEPRESDVLKDEIISSECKVPVDGFREENETFRVEADDEDKCSSRKTKPEDDSVQESKKADAQEEEKKENRSLGTIIMERLSEQQTEDKASVETAKDEAREFVPENVELRNICRDLLNDLLNGINQLIDENSQEETRSLDDSFEESKDSRSPDLSTTSLHCSLPLDKVASVLQNCQTNELAAPQSPSSSSSSSSQGSKSPSKPASPTVRHLCLYCDRKFLSISLRQRHTERVHQQGGGRRSERNSRRPSQNCQYCSDKCSESLESLFQHMVGSHGDKYYACVQCSTRYLTREALVGHMSENHTDRSLQIQEKMKEASPCKELGNQSPRDRLDPLSPKERRSDESDHEHRAESILLKPMLSAKDNFSNPGSPEFDSSFYSSVSCNIRENLLHHLDGKLQSCSSTTASTTSLITDSKLQLQQQQTYYEHNVNQIQFPIDISLTAATPVYSKDYANEEYENNSEYAQKPGKRNRSHPRRVSFEKYNFPRKYDGKEQWTCSIKDLSKFDISTQLSLRKKQQLLKERLTLSRLHQISVLSPSEITDIVQDEEDLNSVHPEESKSVDEASSGAKNEGIEQMSRFEASRSAECKVEGAEATSSRSTEFSTEFGNFLRLRKWDEKMSNEAAKKQETVYAELTGEWSRPRIYICGACATRHVTLKEMEDHKAISHPNVWCSHFEFSGDQRELYKHLFLPGRNVPTAKAKAAMLAEKVCTKCSKNCTTLSELHRHMLECGGDQAWLLGLFGNGKKKCKWRPFGSRSRRRRQRGMKRNIQNSQTPRVNTPKEKQPTGPRVRPSDRESIQKMLANLPPKRATRKVLQDSTMRTQGRLRNVQTRTRPRMVGDNSTASRMSRNKAVLRNKLLKNAKSIQRNRCRIDNISAVIESVVRNYQPDNKTSDDEDTVDGSSIDKETKEKSVEELNAELVNEKGNRKAGRGPRVLGKRRNVKTKGLDQPRKTFKARTKGMLKNPLETKTEGSSEFSKAPKGARGSPKNVEKEAEVIGLETSPVEAESPNFFKNKFSAQTTPKRKRPVDPVASLNASIKAKSQLRTQDGKFAKNPNKDQFSPVKSSENKSPVFGRQLSKEKINEINPETSVTRSKLRTVSRNRNNDQPPKRTTRLSSDSDKMPTLEPVVQISSNNEDYTETTANDLPILSPVTPSSSSEKASRGKNVVSKVGARKMIEGEETEGKGETGDAVQGEERDQKPAKGRRPKTDPKKLENSAGKIEGAKGMIKEKTKRKSAPARMLNIEEKRTVGRNVDDTGLKKEMKQKREEGAKTLDTRSNFKTKSIDEEPIKLENVPFEVKKLIGSDNKDDLMNKLVLTSLTTASKRCLRQSMSRVKFGQTKSKIRKDMEMEKKADSGSMSDASTKKEKFEARRKSLRSTERKFERTRAAKEDKFDQGNKICEAVNEVKAAIRGRRSNSLSNESKSTMNTSQMSSDKTDESIAQNSDKRQTRGSLMNSTEEQNELGEVFQKKITGKRRGRVRSNIDVSDKKNIEVNKSSSTESTDKTSPIDQNKSKLGEENVAKDKQETPNVSDTNKVNANRLQVETSNSVDSGKENTLETPAPVQKQKVGRPRKSWGAKRERTSKRSLNNVIGILTEGMNIPAETQQSAPVAPQPTVDAVNSEEITENTVQRLNDDPRPVNEDKSNKQVTEETDTPIQKSGEELHQPEASETSEKESTVQDTSEENQKEEVSSKNTKQPLPTDDIILDLSRRKQKGKGSFLEKIVSKIAKQKDALLEGEVGSLLDTAADELTSILDEVGPALSEVAENSVEKTNYRNLGGKDSKSEREGTSLEPLVTLKQSKEEKEINEEKRESYDDKFGPEKKNIESSSDTNTLIDNKETINNNQMQSQITPKETCEVPKILTEDSNKDIKVSLEPVEAIPSLKTVNEKVSKIHKHSNKEGHRRSRGRKAATRAKTAEFINESEDSEDENKIELQNKNKIVKSVFGRVFGGEKTDKAKDVLNDWVSKSEEESNLSKINFGSVAPKGVMNEEISKTKNVDKNSKGDSITVSVPPTIKKKPGRKPKNSSLSNKTIQDSSSSYPLSVPPNKSRHSKKIAEERISRSLFLGMDQKETNYGLRSQSKPDFNIKDSGYGSFSNDEDFSKMVSLENSLEEDQMKDADSRSRDTKAEDKETSSGDSPKEISNDAKSIRKEIVEVEVINSASKQEAVSNQPNSPCEESASLEVQKESGICDTEIACIESSSVSNVAQLPAVKNISEEREGKTVSEETKIKRKSKKRSLEGSSPKKSKRKSVEPVDNSEENLIPDELDLADIMELIDKSKQVPSTKDNFEDDLSVDERIQFGKRKTISQDSELKDSDSKMVCNTRVGEESIEIVKKRKVNSEENKTNKRDEVDIEINNTEDPETDQNKVIDEDKRSLLLNISEERTSSVASADHCQKSESPDRSSSKNKLVNDEKVNEPSNEDTLSGLESEVTECAASESEVTKRSSNVVTANPLKNEDKNKEQTESGSNINIDNVEGCQSAMNETLNVTEGPKVAGEESTLKNTENQVQSENLIKNVAETNSTVPVQPSVVVKVLKKRGRKKKNPDAVQTKVINQENSRLQSDQVPRRSLRTNRFNEDTEEQSKNSNDTNKSQTASPSLEQFKVPEVTEVLQHTKKRTYKRRSTTDEHLDSRSNSSPIESEMNAKHLEINKTAIEKEEQPQSIYQKDFLENKQRSSRDSHLGLERSSFSESIDLSQTSRTRSSKRKQLSSEDLSARGSLNFRAESVDNLSETSCTSESSYFRKKRFTKRKKELQVPPEDVQTDTSVTDSESMDTEKPADRRQSLRRKAKENISFEDSAFDLVDYFDIPMDIQDSPQANTVENSVSQEPEPSTTEELVDEATVNNVSNQEPEEIITNEDKATEDTKKSEVDEEDDSKEEEKAGDKLEELPQSQDDFQTPKKRAAGNFVVVHKKTGEILIVEKRKKLTKEAARFFCDVCATSFTRKSSLKKHNQSQSHLLQVTKFRKDKSLMECKDNLEDTCSIGQNEVSSDENRSTTDEVKKDQKENFLDSLYDQTDLKSIDDESNSFTGPADEEFLMDSQQRILEDELLDEEICKITENMSHDEYVLTDQVSPVPESTSTPIKVESTKTEEVGKKKKHERKKEKTTKRNLSDEQITLDSSEDSVASAVNEECNFQKKCLKDVVRLDESQNVDDSINLKNLEQETKQQKETESNLDTKAENLNDKDVHDEGHPSERLCLKLTIKKSAIADSKKQDPLNQLEALSKDDEEKSENLLDSFTNPIKDINELEPEIDRLDLDTYLGSSKQVESGRNTENVEDFDTFKVQSLEEDLADQQNSSVTENEKQNESVKETRHGKSKKSKGKKHQDEIENSEDTVTRKTSKSKDNQNKQISETINSQKSTDNSKTLEYNDENPELLLYDSQLENKCIKVNNVISPSKLEAEEEEESNELKITEDQGIRKLQQELKFLEEAVLRQSTEEQRNNQENADSRDKISSFHSIDEDEDSSSSSLADKPLSQLLLRTNTKVEASKKLLIDSDDELRPREKNTEDPNAITDDQRCSDKKVANNEQMESQISSEEECEVEIPKIETEDSNKDTKISLEPEEMIPSLKDVDDKESDDTEESKTANNNEKSSVNDRQGSNQKVSKAHKHSSKEGHWKSKNKKAPVRSKLADLTSDSDDSEDEDKIELQNKSKIVKSVFGRVFGGEKTDKVKEVLNDWVSKSEDDSDVSRGDFKCVSPRETNAEETSETRNEDKNSKRHSIASSVPSTIKKKSGRKSKDVSSSDKTKEKNPSSENREELRANRHSKSRNSSGNHKKSEEDPSDYYFLVLPPNKSRHSKKIAEERISKAFDGVRMFEEFLGGDQKEGNYGLRSQSKPDLTIKDSGYGSFNYDEDSSKMVCLEEPLEEEQKLIKKRKSSSSRTSKGKTDSEDWKDLVMEMRSLKNSKEPTDEEDNSIKDLPEQEPLSAGLKSRSCSSLAPSSVRNRSPSMDRNSQSTRDSDEEDEDIGRGRISPLFVRETPGSCIGSSSNSENEEEDENVVADESVMRKRSSSEFSGEKIVIRSPSSTHKGEVVTIAPTDAIEDNALDVPQEIETAKPRQGKVLNFDEELFVECCSRLKATTENELRGAKKIKLDHNEGYHRKDDQQQGLRGPRDRWRDVESQNSLGSLLESVNQLLGEEMYSTRERDYPKRGGRNLTSEHSSRSASPDMSRADNLGYEDSLDVAFEHNNKLRDKIQQRMRESENLIASTFGKSSNDSTHHNKNSEHDPRNSYSHLQDQGHVSGACLSNRNYNDALHIRSLQEQQNTAKMHLDSGFKNKMNSSLGGLLDKALSNLLHSNGKHDHNGSTPMKVLAELACARAPTSTTGLPTSQEAVQPAKPLLSKESIPDPCPLAAPKDIQKKPRNPIKELFERKKEMNERKQQEKSKTEAALRELNIHRQRKTKKIKKHQDFPLIRRDEHGAGLVERKKRRDGFERKEEFVSDRIKDVYDFDEEESQIEPNLGSVMSYRSRPGYEVSCLRTKDVDVAGLMSKAIGDSLENGKTSEALSSRLESMIDKKFKELEKFAPKTKGALKSFQSEDQQQITGPMDEFVERKQLKSKRPVEQSLKHSKLKKRSKNPKKKTRNAWYENDSSDEYRTTAVKTDDIGVGISKSQRTCSKGKQNIFAELYTSSESEFEHEGVNYESKRQRRVKKGTKKVTESENLKQSQELVNKYSSENEDHENDDWRDQDLKDEAKHESDHKKSESEMSDHPLVIDERKDVDDQRNSDEETETQYERNYEMDDLYREDSSIVDSDVEDSMTTEAQNAPEESRAKSSISLQERTNGKPNCIRDELIPLEEALDLLDQANNETLETKYSNIDKNVKSIEDTDPVITTEPDVSETFYPVEESAVKSPSLVEEQEQEQELEQEEEPDNDLLSLPEKLSSNEKPQKESDNLPLHVFLSRKVQESKKRKEQQLKKMQEEQERILMDFQPTRRQRKCAIGKQGLLAEISSSDEEISPRDRRSNDKSDHDKPRKQKRESKEKRKERYIEKKHEQMIAKEQKAIEEEILREVGKKKDSLTQNTQNPKSDLSDIQHDPENTELLNEKVDQESSQKKKHQIKEKQKKSSKTDEEVYVKNNTEGLDDSENNCNKSTLAESNHEDENNQESPMKQKKHSKSLKKPKKTSKGDTKVTTTNKKTKSSNSDKSKNRTDSKGSRDKERRSSNGKHDSDDEELKTTKSWNKVEEGVGVAIGRRKRAAANQLYYWSSSSDEEEMLEVVPVVEEEEDDRQEQHGWIVGDSHKRMITMLAMEKQLKEKRRRSEDEFEPGRAKSKKHRNSTS